MKISRRDLVKGATAAGALAAFGLGYGPVLARTFGGTAGRPTDPDIVVGPEGYLYSSCLQCNTGCGIKVKVVNGEAVKIEGNPYSPFNRFPHLAYSTGVVQAANEFGALCPKGQAGLQTAYDPYRIVRVLKRKPGTRRGENRWVTIEFDRALQEIAEGGDLFGEGRVPGLRESYALTDPEVAKAMAAAVKAILAESKRDGWSKSSRRPSLRTWPRSSTPITPISAPRTTRWCSTGVG